MLHALYKKKIKIVVFLILNVLVPTNCKTFNIQVYLQYTGKLFILYIDVKQ